MGKRKVLAAVGYGLAAVAKPIFHLAPLVAWVIAARFIHGVRRMVPSLTSITAPCETVVAQKLGRPL